MSAADPTPAHFRRLHPLDARSARVGMAGNGRRLRRPGGAVLPVSRAASWPFSRSSRSSVFSRVWPTGGSPDTASTATRLRIDSGIFERRSRRVRLDRLQAVDVVRPLAGRLLGVSELRLEVAGGSSTEAPLAYLSADDALALRAELLARAAGIDAATPEAPERVLHEVPPGRLLGSTVLSGTFVMGVALLIALGGTLAFFGVEIAAGVLSSALPGVVTIGYALWNQFVRNFGFVLAESPDGFRIRKGLLDTKAQTVPPGRIQGVALRQTILWRLTGWVRVDVDVAGYGASSGMDSGTSSTLLPVATYADAVDVLRRALAGADPAGVASRSRTSAGCVAAAGGLASPRLRGERPRDHGSGGGLLPDAYRRSTCEDAECSADSRTGATAARARHGPRGHHAGACRRHHPASTGEPSAAAGRGPGHFGRDWRERPTFPSSGCHLVRRTTPRSVDRVQRSPRTSGNASVDRLDQPAECAQTGRVEQLDGLRRLRECRQIGLGVIERQRPRGQGGVDAECTQRVRVAWSAAWLWRRLRRPPRHMNPEQRAR